MGFKKIDAESTSTKPAQPEVTYDKWYLKELIISAHPDRDTCADAVFIKGRHNSDNDTWELSDVSEDRKLVSINSLEQLSAANSDINDVVDGVIDALEIVGKAQGIL